MRPIPKALIDLVKANESLRLESYQDPAGVWTVGWGSTKGVHAGMRITPEEADSRLLDDLSDARNTLYGVVNLDLFQPAPEGLTEGQYTALLDFVFNLGAHDRKTGKVYTVLQLVNKRQFDQVPQWLVKYVKAGGVKLNGLVKRRNAEIELWSAGEPGSSDDNPPSSYTREEPTPPVATNPTPLAKQPAFLAVVVSVAMAAPGLVSQAVAALTPYAADPIVQHVLDVLTRASPLVGALSAFALALQHQQSKT